MMLLFALVVLTTQLCTTSSDCNDDGYCVAGGQTCACFSGFFGDTCESQSTCPTPWENADLLQTGHVPIILDTSRIQTDNIHIDFSSPIVSERYNYRITIGGFQENVCDSWYGDGWYTSVDDDCNVLHGGVLSWDDVEDECAWDTSLSDADTAVYTNTLYFSVMEDLDVKQRGVSWDYSITVQIPQTVLVDVIDIDVLSPVDLDAILFEQDVYPTTSKGLFMLWTSVQYPYVLTYNQMNAEPSDITSSVADGTKDCPDTSGDCDQDWENTIAIGSSKCDVTGSYTYEFLLNCRPGYTTCPYEDEPITVTTTIVSENFCDEVTLTTDLTATMESCEDAACETLENGFITTSTAYFLVDIDSPQLTVHESTVQSVWLTSGSETINLFIDFSNTGDGNTASFAHTPLVDPLFQFDLGAIPPAVYTVHAKVAVTYDYEHTVRRSTVETLEATYKLKATKDIYLEGSTTDDDEVNEAGSAMSSLLMFFVLFVIGMMF